MKIVANACTVHINLVALYHKDFRNLFKSILQVKVDLLDDGFHLSCKTGDFDTTIS